jgi:hypothetical protein
VVWEHPQERTSLAVFMGRGAISVPRTKTNEGVYRHQVMDYLEGGREGPCGGESDELETRGLERRTHTRQAQVRTHTISYKTQHRHKREIAITSSYKAG